MSAPDLKVSRPEDFGPLERVTVLVELPVAVNGRRPVVKVRALNNAEFTLAASGVPTMGGEQNADPEAGLRVTREIARLGIVEPAFAFGAVPSPGAVWWDDLPAGNQNAIVRAIYRASGIDLSPDKGAAEELATFPPERGRGSDSAAPGAAVPALQKAAR